MSRTRHLLAVLLILSFLAFGCGIWDSEGRGGDDIPDSSSTSTQAPATTPQEQGGGQYYEDDSAVYLLKIESLMGVFNGGKQPTFEAPSPHTITSIMTYHYNDGAGATPGQISLRAEDGTTYGPWDATGTEGQGGVADAYWWVYPDEEIPAGTYTVIDSDPATWSQNEETGGLGVAWVEAVAAASE